MLKDFKEFAMRGNVIDMAVGIIIGASFGGIVKSLVDDIIMPPIGMLLGNVDFADLFVVLKDGTTPAPYLTVDAAREAGAVTLNYGLFINALVSFTIVAFAVFMLIRMLNKLKREEAPKQEEAVAKDCPRCFSTIPIKATRCPNCTSVCRGHTVTNKKGGQGRL